MGQDSSKESEGGLQQYKLERNFDVDGVYQTFINAACGELKLVQEFIDASPSNKLLIKTARNKRGHNLLMAVCATTNPKLYFSLHAASLLQKERERLEVVKYLLQPGLELFDINEVAPFIPRNETFDPRSNDPDDVFNLLGNDHTALGFACSYKTLNADLIETLLLEGANPNQESPSGKVTPLMLASAAQFPKAVAELLATNKVNPSGAESIAGYTPLHLLALNGSPSCDNRTKQEDAVACAELLIAAGADIEARNGTIDTPFLSAVLYAPLEEDSLVRYFIRAGCDVFDFGFAIHNRLMEFHVGRSESKLLKLFDHQDSANDVKVFSTIISKEATKKIRSSKKNRLCEAILLGSIGVLECVLAGGVSVNAICEIVPGVKVTPLQLACSVYPNISPAGVSNGTKDFRPDDDTLAVEMTRLLLKAGANADLAPEKDPNAINPFTNFPPLFIAAANRVDSRSLVKLLVEQGKANANVEFDSLTPLLTAIRYNNYFVCEYFVNTLKIVPLSHEQYQRLQEFIHVTETNLANDVIDATRIISTEDRQKLKNNHRNKSLLSFDVPLSSTELVRPFERDADAPEYDQINLKFISLLLPPKTVEQEAVVAPLHFHPQLFSLQIENDLATNTSKVVIGPSPRSSVVSLAPEDRVKRIAFGFSRLTNEEAKTAAQEEINRVCRFGDGYDEERLRELMTSHNAQIEPTSDECFSFKLKRLENQTTPQQAEFDKKNFMLHEKKVHFLARVNNFYAKYDPTKKNDAEFTQKIATKYLDDGEDVLMSRLVEKYGPEPPFNFIPTAAAVAAPRTDAILDSEFKSQETINSSAHRPNIGEHFPSTNHSLFLHQPMYQFFIHEFQLLFAKFEPEERVSSRSFLFAYIIVMRNIRKKCYNDNNLFAIYSRMWKEYNKEVVAQFSSNASDFVFSPLPLADNNNVVTLSYLLPLVERIHLQAAFCANAFAEFWSESRRTPCSELLRKSWMHFAKVTKTQEVARCAYDVPSTWQVYVITVPEKTGWTKRLTAFFTKYDQEQVATVESMVSRYKGLEDQLISSLVAKYGPEPAQNEIFFDEQLYNTKIADPFTTKSDESKRSWSNPTISEAFRRRATEYVRNNSRSSTDLPLLNNILPQFVGNEFTFLKNYSMSRLGLADGAKKVVTLPFNKRKFQIPASCFKAAMTVGLMNTTSPPPQDVVRARLERFYTKYDSSKLDQVDKVLQTYAGKEEALYQALTGKYGPEPPEPSWSTTISICTKSGMPLAARLTAIAKVLPPAVSERFGFAGKTVDEISKNLKVAGSQLRAVCEGKLFDVESNRETECELVFDNNDDDAIVAFVCLKYNIDEPKPASPALRTFLLPQLQLTCKEGVILDAMLQLVPDEKLTAAGGGTDNLVIEVVALIRTSQSVPKKCATSAGVGGELLEAPSFVVSRKFQFVACDLGVANNQQQQSNNVNDDLTSEFSL